MLLIVEDGNGRFLSPSRLYALWVRHHDKIISFFFCDGMRMSVWLFACLCVGVCVCVCVCVCVERCVRVLWLKSLLFTQSFFIVACVCVCVCLCVAFRLVCECRKSTFSACRFFFIASRCQRVEYAIESATWVHGACVDGC